MEDSLTGHPQYSKEKKMTALFWIFAISGMAAWLLVIVGLVFATCYASQIESHK
jgi:hypothetical protein